MQPLATFSDTETFSARKFSESLQHTWIQKIQMSSGTICYIDLKEGWEDTQYTTMMCVA